MTIPWIIHIIILTGLGIATVTDIKKREVPDTLNFLMISIGLIIGIIGSIIQGTWQNFLSSILGLVIGYVIGALMFYTGQWGGGDAKMLMGIGSIIGVTPTLIKNFLITINGQEVITGLGIPFFITTIITIFIAGGIYGIVYMLYLAINNWQEFQINFRKKREDKKIVQMRIFTISFVILCIAGAILVKDQFLRLIIAFIGAMMIIAQYLYIISKVIENIHMIKTIHPKQLSEGDWILNDILVTREKNQLKLLEDKTRLEISQNKNKFFSFIYYELKDLKIFKNNKKINSLKPITKTKEEINKEFQNKFQNHITKITLSQTRNKITFILNSKVRANEIKKIAKVLSKKTNEWKRYLDEKEIKRIKKELKNIGVTENKIRICGPKDLGITNDQIKELKTQKIKKIKIKEGIPFIPGFLLGYVLMVVLGNWILLFF